MDYIQQKLKCLTRSSFYTFSTFPYSLALLKQRKPKTFFLLVQFSPTSLTILSKKVNSIKWLKVPINLDL